MRRTNQSITRSPREWLAKRGCVARSYSHCGDSMNGRRAYLISGLTNVGSERKHGYGLPSTARVAWYVKCGCPQKPRASLKQGAASHLTSSTARFGTPWSTTWVAVIPGLEASLPHRSGQHSRGAHGVRHSFAREEVSRFVETGFGIWQAKRLTSQLLGHWREGIIRVYLR